MASVWGDSWGAAWGDSWGAMAPAVVPDAPAPPEALPAGTAGSGGGSSAPARRRPIETVILQRATVNALAPMPRLPLPAFAPGKAKPTTGTVATHTPPALADFAPFEPAPTTGAVAQPSRLPMPWHNQMMDRFAASLRMEDALLLSGCTDPELLDECWNHDAV